MTEDLANYFATMDALFMSVGWQSVAADIKEWLDAIRDKMLTTTPDLLRYEQGRYAGLMQMYTYYDAVKATRDSIETPAMPDVTDSYEQDGA